MQTARDDAEPAVLTGRREGAGLPLAVDLLTGGTAPWNWIFNLAVWLAIFVTGAVWSLRRDTARV